MKKIKCLLRLLFAKEYMLAVCTSDTDIDVFIHATPAQALAVADWLNKGAEDAMQEEAVDSVKELLSKNQTIK